jgi:FixJ family two-component response regulator
MSIPGVEPAGLPAIPMSSEFVPADYTILVVESDQRARADLASLLARVGFQTQVFASAEALLETIDACPVRACVLAEIELPGMTALELTARLRERNCSVPVIILTRLSDVATAVKAMRSTVADYLVKPYVERDLVNRVRAVLTRPQMTTH